MNILVYSSGMCLMRCIQIKSTKEMMDSWRLLAQFTVGFVM